MSRRREMPAGWRQPPETTAEPVPLLRPYIPPGGFPSALPPADVTPSSLPRFFTRRRPLPPGPTGRPSASAAPPAASGRPAGASRPSVPGPSSGAGRPPVSGPSSGAGRPPLPGLPSGVGRPPLPGPRHGAGRHEALGQPLSAGLTTAPGQPLGAGRPPAPAQRPTPGRAPAMRHWRPMRAIIGDEVRIPILWCEFGICIARFTSPTVLDERDLRARALEVGWRYDVLGRLACPGCASTDPAFRDRRAPARAVQDPWRR